MNKEEKTNFRILEGNELEEFNYVLLHKSKSEIAQMYLDEKQKRLKTIKFLKDCMNPDNSYLLDKFQVEQVIKILGGDE